jgi:hypothetical protein
MPLLRPATLSSLLALLLAAATIPAPALAGTTATASDDPTPVRVLTSPPRILASIAPGTNSTAPLIVMNQSKSSISLLVRVNDLAPDPDSASFGVLTDVGDAPRGAGEWLSVDRPTLELGPGERATVKVRIDVPDDATAGGHYGAIVVETAADETDDAPVQLRVRLVTHVNVLVPGDVQYAAKLSELRATAISGGRLLVTARYENTGNIQSTPRSTKVRVTGPGGSTTASIKVPETMPGGARKLEKRVDIPSPAGRFSSRISLELEDGSSVRSGTVETVAWRDWVPWAIAAVIGVLLLLLSTPFYLRRRRFQRLVEQELAAMEDDSFDEHSVPDDPDRFASSPD